MVAAAEAAEAAAAGRLEPLRLNSLSQASFVSRAAGQTTVAAPQDGFTPGETGPSATRRPVFSVPSAPRFGWLGKTARMAVLAVALATVPFSSAVYAAQGQTQQQQQEADRFGISPELTQKLLERPALVDTLRTLPDSITSQYKDLNPQQRKVMGKLLSGSSWGVNHRGAFISGRAMGMDAFPKMKGRLDDEVKKKNLTAAEADMMKRALDQMKPLTPTQREGIADFILLERSLEAGR